MESSADSQFQRALALHRQLRLEEARSAYEAVLNLQPGHSQALMFLIVIAVQVRDPDQALALTGKVIDGDPRNALVHLLQGHARSQLGQREAALGSYDRVIALQPQIAEAHFYRGNMLAEIGRQAEAIASYDRALALNSSGAETHNNRGNALRHLGRFDDAILSYDRAIASAPQFAEPYFNRGLALHDLRRHAEALSSLDAAIERKPDYAEAHCSRGDVLRLLRQMDAALASYDRAIAASPHHAQAHCNRGNVLRDLQRYEAALESYDAAIYHKSDYADAHCNRGSLLGEMGDCDEAMRSLERAIAVDPGHAHTHLNRSFLRLLSGKWEDGWRDFEWRWQDEHCATSRERRSFTAPLWLGGAPLHGKTILLCSEQGLGDTIQFCRYATLVADLGAEVILEVPAVLADVLGSLRGVAQRVVRGAALPRFDYFCPLMSLPLAFNTTPFCVPATIPYLRSSAHRAAEWGSRLGPRSKVRVGLVWSGGLRPDQPELWAVNDRRNVPLAALAPLQHPDVEFHSLQKGLPAEAQLKESVATGWGGPDIVDHSGELHDFAETAALIEHLDLVISVDTATAHLAAAMGKAVWLLNRFDTCWRWMLNRSDSPWYPTLRLYRQERPGDWAGVVRRVRIDLERLARH